ncbi:MAG: hypothetical protein H0X40_03740 [Chthoniobacterales bacterium]|nr:hypothetical protein [Chthoniobacterales bacterium]
MTKKNIAQGLLGFTFLQCAIILVLSLSSHFFGEPGPTPPAKIEQKIVALPRSQFAFTPEQAPRPVLPQPAQPIDHTALNSATRAGEAAVAPLLLDPQVGVRGSRALKKKLAANVPQPGDVSPANLFPPTFEQAQQTLDIPLAFFGSSAASGLTPAQTADVAKVADQFVSAVGVNQDPADPVYAGRYYTAQELADAQVFAVSGQTAYMALIDARAQAAGNAPSTH